MKKFKEFIKSTSGIWGIILFLGFCSIWWDSCDNDTTTMSEEEYEEILSEEEQANQELAEDYYGALEAERLENQPLYFIDNGYYFHDDINCKGLEGYSKDELNRITPDELWEHKELSPCNWCVKGDN